MSKHHYQSAEGLIHSMGTTRIARKRDLCRAHLEGQSAPLLLLDESEIYKSLEYFSTHLPYVKLHYAMKANSHESILALMKAQGHNLDVASSGEIRMAQAAGFSGRQMILANTIKSDETIENLFRCEIQTFTFDSPSDLKRIAEFRSKLGAQHNPRCLLRLQPTLQISLEKRAHVQLDLSKKFGCDPKQAKEMFQLALSLGLKPAGIAFHVGSNCENPNLFIENFIGATELLNRLNRELNLKMNVIDIGGGFPNLAAQGQGIDSLTPFYTELAKGFKKAGPETFEVLAEPGRTIAGPSGTLVSRIIGMTELNGRNILFLNEGVYGHYSGILHDNASFMYFPVEDRWFNKSVTLAPFTIAGPTCCSTDILAENVFLPKDIQVGEHLFTVDIGAYSRELATGFNGCVPAKTVFIPASQKKVAA